jgi:hypothetical protein
MFYMCYGKYRSNLQRGSDKPNEDIPMYPETRNLLTKLFFILAACSLFLVLPPSVEAGKNLKGNGFPAGFHYNLNLLGKKTQAPGVFQCPSEAAYRCDTDDSGIIPCDPITETCIQVWDDTNTLISCHENSSQNVVFIPRYDEPETPTSVGIQSGSSKGGKNRTLQNADLDGDGIPDLQVTDWCTEAFPDTDGADSAIVTLPAYDAGYAVFARVTGKPCNDVDDEGNCTTSTSFSNELGFVTDDQGNDLLALGFVTHDGTWNDFSLEREQDGTKTKGPGGKGVKKATDISSAFTFSGTVCYISPGDQTYFCDSQGVPVDVNDDSETDYWLPAGAWFWDNPDDNGDGATTTAVGVAGEDDWADVDPGDTDANLISDMLENYILADYQTVQGCDVNAYCYKADGTLYEEIIDQAGLDACNAMVATDTASGAVPSIGYFEQWSDPKDPETGIALVADAPAVATCKSWTDEWIFNIADFVELIWGIDNKGSYNVQVRFYPYDQVCDQLPGGCQN